MKNQKEEENGKAEVLNLDRLCSGNGRVDYSYPTNTGPGARRGS
jgi:hypothetical protein